MSPNAAHDILDDIQEPSKHYTCQTVHIYGGLHKWFRQQLTRWQLLFLGSLEKRPANVHPLSLITS